MSDVMESAAAVGVGVSAIAVCLHVCGCQWRDELRSETMEPVEIEHATGMTKEQYLRWRGTGGEEMSRHIGQGEPVDGVKATAFCMAAGVFIGVVLCIAAGWRPVPAWVWEAIARNRGFSTMALGLIIGFWASYRFLRKRGELR